MCDSKALETIRPDLEKLDEGDPLESAICREQAQDILATPTIALEVREEVAEQLNQANLLLTIKTVKPEESY